MTEPIDLTLSIDLDKHLAEHRGYDRDGEPISGPTITAMAGARS